MRWRKTGGRPAAILAAQTKILLSTDFKIPFASPVDWAEILLNVGNEEWLENDDGSDSGTDTPPWETALKVLTQMVEEGDNGDTGRERRRVEGRTSQGLDQRQETGLCGPSP